MPRCTTHQIQDSIECRASPRTYCTAATLRALAHPKPQPNRLERKPRRRQELSAGAFRALHLLVVAGEAQRVQRLADADRAPAVEEVGGGGVRHALALRDGAGRLRQRALRVVLTASHNPPSAAQKTVARSKMGRGGTYGDECLDLLDGEVRGLGQQDGNVAGDVRARHRRAGRRRVPARPRTRREQAALAQLARANSGRGRLAHWVSEPA